MIEVGDSRGGVHPVYVTTKRIDASNARLFRQEIAELVQGGASLLVLDLSGVEFVDSSGLGALVGVLKLIGSRGDLALASLRPSVEKMLKLTRMDRVFQIFADSDTAVASLAGHSSP